MATSLEPRTVAERMVDSAWRHRFWSMVIGYLAALLLIGGGILFTQRDIDKKIHDNTDCETEVSAKFGEYEFVARNTAPGIVLILCGTGIAMATIRRNTYAKTQWKDGQNPGFTEINC